MSQEKLMETINGKLITTHPDNAAYLKHQLEQVVEKSQQLETAMMTQTEQIQGLRLSLRILESQLDNSEEKQLKQMKLTGESLEEKLRKKAFTLTAISIFSLVSLWGWFLFKPQCQANTQKKAESIEMIYSSRNS